jgi:class 3 adenylate cyclase
LTDSLQSLEADARTPAVPGGAEHAPAGPPPPEAVEEPLDLQALDATAVPAPPGTPARPRPDTAAPVRGALVRDPALIGRVLHLLRQFGWETGLKQLRAELEKETDPSRHEALLFFTGWMAGERGAYREAARLFREYEQLGPLTPWANVGQAFLAQRQKQFAEARELLRRAEQVPHPPDPVLQATIAHLRGALAQNQGQPAEALDHLRQALRLFGSGHFGTGRVLDTIGMVYAATDHFHAAEEFYLKALECKRRFQDQEGMAVTYGNLGRLYFDWGELDRAADYFHRNHQLCQNTLNPFGVALMQNWLGRVELARGQQAAAARDRDQAKRHFKDAAGLLNACRATAAERDWTVAEGYAHKDLALLRLAERKPDEAEREAGLAEPLFQRADFEEGLTHVTLVWGLIDRQRGRHEDSQRRLATARAWFEAHGEPAEVARTELELARTLQAAKAPLPEIVKAFEQALASAEASRRPRLVRAIEDELKAVSPQVYAQYVFQRVRGRGVPADTSSLLKGQRVPGTVLYLDLKGSSLYTKETDPVVVQATLNQMLAILIPVLRRHDGVVSGFRGDGFLALFLGQGHATAAVSAGLDLFAELKRFNEPRALLGLPEFVARVGIATGEVSLGNVGTYDKMDYTVIGNAANLGARLEAEAKPGWPCIAPATRQDVGDRFTYQDPPGRSVDLKSFGPQRVWDVTGRNPKP